MEESSPYRDLDHIQNTEYEIMVINSIRPLFFPKNDRSY
jgi:hypothetical protein